MLSQVKKEKEKNQDNFWSFHAKFIKRDLSFLSGVFTFGVKSEPTYLLRSVSKPFFFLLVNTRGVFIDTSSAVMNAMMVRHLSVYYGLGSIPSACSVE